MANIANMVKEENGIRFLAKGSSEHKSSSYNLYGYFDATNVGPARHMESSGKISSFNELQEKRKEGGKEEYKKQLAYKGKISVPNIGTSVAFIGDFILKDGTRKELLICPTKKKGDALWASVFSGYVNDIQSEGTRYSPIFYTMMNEVHEELLVIDNNGELAWFDFGFEQYPVFGHGEFKEILKVSKVDHVSWLKTMKVNILPDNEKSSKLVCFNDKYPWVYDCFIDTRWNNMQAVATYRVTIDLSKYQLCSSETAFKGGCLYEEFYDGQGYASKLVLLEACNPFNGKAFKPDMNSDLGIVEGKYPDMLSEFFATNIDDRGIAYTNGDKVFE